MISAVCVHGPRIQLSELECPPSQRGDSKQHEPQGITEKTIRASQNLVTLLGEPLAPLVTS
jgi:hypothetical protein